MDGCHISNQPDANFEGLLTLEESVERMSLEIYDMLQDEAQNRISTSPVSTQTYNVFVLKKSLNVWILGDSARGDAAIQFGQMTELSELFNGFDVETLEGATPEITFPDGGEVI